MAEERKDAEDEGGAEQPAASKEAGDGSPTEDAGDLTAPSIGPNTVIEKEPPDERLGRHEQSDTDAMGLDKRREVVGGTYSAPLSRQLTLYGIFLAIVAALAFGGVLLAKELDKPPDEYADKAPWTNSTKPPAELQ